MVLWCSRGAIEQSLLIFWALLLPQKLSGTAESEAPTKPALGAAELSAALSLHIPAVNA